MPNRIRELREHMNLTPAELAKLLEVKQSTISRWESGELEPGPEHLKALRRVFKIRGIHELFVAPTEVATG